jgi:predicted nucleotidyltransferase component of viral defense system
MTPNLLETDKAKADSLLAKIKNASTASKLSMPMAMRRYAYERMLKVMADNGMSDGFCLKGGMLLGAMFKGRLLRPTEDLDLNGLIAAMSIRDMENDLRKIAALHDGSDGLRFDVSTLKVVKNRDDDIIKGGKIHITAFIGKTKIPMKIDVGYGNPITPGVEMIEMPTLLPSLISSIPFKAYPIETVISEKVHAMFRHGLLNSRHKDYFDIMMLAKNYDIDGGNLTEAIINTFDIFKTPDSPPNPVPKELPALSKAYSTQRSQQAQWQAFLMETHADDKSTFAEAVEYCADLIYPAINAVHTGDNPGLWMANTGWVEPRSSLTI